MISQYIQLQRATHREKEIVLFKFWNREDWKKSIKKLPLVRFSRTRSAYYMPYTKEAYASFKNTNIPHKYPKQIDTTESLPSDREVVDIEPSSSSNVKSLLGNDAGDTYISDSQKMELEIIWNAKGFSIHIPYNENDISFIRKLEKSWWNNKVKLWYLKSSIHNLDEIQKRWTYFDKETYIRLYGAIRNLEEPIILEVYSSPEYPGSVLFKLKGYKSSPALIKTLRNRQYDKVYKRWIVPYNEKMVKDVIEAYKSKGYTIVNNMTTAYKKGMSQDDIKIKSLKILLSKIDANKRSFFEKYANVFLRLGRSPNTAKIYITAILKILVYYKIDEVSELDEAKINAYLSIVANGGMSDSGLNIVVSAIKFCAKFMNVGNDWNLIEIKRPKKGFIIPKILSKNEMRLFLEAIDNTKHLCIVYVLYGSGLRAGEVLNLQLVDIYWDRKQIFVKGAKGKKDRVVNISQKLIERMTEYFDVYQPVRYLFEGSKKGKSYSYSSMRQIIQKAKEKANISKTVTAHVMRHSFATHNMDAGVPLPYIQQMLGHKDIKTTMIYMHITKNTFDNYESPLDNM
jgi:site-specific recombinase XerD